jgi:hypothetical protein
MNKYRTKDPQLAVSELAVPTASPIITNNPIIFVAHPI